MALHYFAESAFDDLLTAWRHHGDVKKSAGASIRQRGAARISLEHARDRMHRLRAALYPNGDERSTTELAALCPALDEVVFLGWHHRDAQTVGQAGSNNSDSERSVLRACEEKADYPGNLRCPCGELVPRP